MDSKCPECDTQMELLETSTTLGPGRGRGTLGFTGYCPNPDCPGKDSDLAKAVGPDGSQ